MQAFTWASLCSEAYWWAKEDFSGPPKRKYQQGFMPRFASYIYQLYSNLYLLRKSITLGSNKVCPNWTGLSLSRIVLVAKVYALRAAWRRRSPDYCCIVCHSLHVSRWYLGLVLICWLISDKIGWLVCVIWIKSGVIRKNWSRLILFFKNINSILSFHLFLLIFTDKCISGKFIDKSISAWIEGKVGFSTLRGKWRDRILLFDDDGFFFNWRGRSEIFEGKVITSIILESLWTSHISWIVFDSLVDLSLIDSILNRLSRPKRFKVKIVRIVEDDSIRNINITFFGIILYCMISINKITLFPYDISEILRKSSFAFWFDNRNQMLKHL